MAGYTKINLVSDVEDLAPKHGLEGVESRFARVPLELEKSGLSLFRMEPDFRLPFGHDHSEQEEVYVVVEGSAVMKVGDDEVELATWDALRVPPNTPRGLQAGPEGGHVLAFGAPNTENKDAEVLPDFWPRDG
jgi:mannose-6-phosphate isomerase-like protein (cupin superfamily)